MASDKASEFRAGWRNLGAATLGMGLGVPSYIAVSSLFLRAIRAEFGWSNTLAAGALVALPLTGLALPVIGWLCDRVGVRLVVGASALAFSACLYGLAHLSGSIGEYYAAVIALNLLGAGTGAIGYTRLVAAQFRAARGMALAVAQFGIALLAVLLPPLVGLAITRDGWRGAYLFAAAAALAGGAGAQLLMRPTRQVTRDSEAAGLSVRAAVATRGFWLLGLGVFAISAASLGLVAQFQPVLVDRGIPVRTTTFLLSLMSVSVMVSRLVVGRLLDLRHPTRWAAGAIALAALGAVLLIGAGQSLALTAAAIFLVGLSLGAELDLMAFFCARLFGVRYYGAIYGLLSAFFYLGIAVGGAGYALIRDLSGSFTGAVAGAALLLVCAALAFLSLPHAGERATVAARRVSA